MSDTELGREYRAFISHSAADAVAARRLKRRLESFSLPRSWRGAALGKLLMGQNEQASSNVVAVVLQEQLARVEWLIVCCSPSAAASATVEAEIAAFAAARGREQVIAVLFEGEPRNALPPLLRTGDLFGVDMRPSGDGEELGAARVVARMLGVDFNELRDQVFADHRARTRNRAIAAAAAGAFGVTMSVAAVINLVQKHQALTMAEQAVNVGVEQVAAGDALAGAAGADAETRKAAIDQALAAYERLFETGVHGDAMKARRAATLLGFADIYGAAGAAEAQGTQAAAALALYGELPERLRSGVQYARALAAAGAAALAAGREDEAIDQYTRAIAAARPLTGEGASGPRARAVLAETLQALGDLHAGADRPEQALPLLAEAAPLLAANVEAAPEDEPARAALMATLERLSTAQAAAGDQAASAGTLTRAIEAGRAWREAMPESLAAKTELGLALLRYGQALADANDARAARPPLTESIGLLREAAAAAPQDQRTRAALTLSLWTTANALSALRQSSDALMDEAIALVREDAARAPRDNELKDQLARMLNVRAQRLVSARDHAAAKELRGEIVQLRRSIRTRSDEGAPGPSVDLAAALEQLGDTHGVLGERDEQMAAYREAVVWRRRAITAGAQGAEPEAALAAALQKYGAARLAADDRPGAIRSLGESARRRRAIAEANPADAALAVSAVEAYQQVAQLQTPADLAGARASLEAAVGLLERLVGDHPDDARYRANLRRVQQRLAAIDPPTQ